MYPVFDTANIAMVEELLAQFEANPDSVGAEWKAYFMGWMGANDVSLAQEANGGSGGGQAGGDVAQKRVHFVRAWRKWGHVAAKLDPLSAQPEVPYALTPEAFGLKETELDDLCKKVRTLYSGTVGLEVGYVADPAERAWMLKWWEGEQGSAKADAATRTGLLRGLVEANALEQYLHKKFVGAKRFSVEGNDAAIPLINWLADKLASVGGKNLVLGMAHRGRLNVLCHVVGKPYAELLAAFADKLQDDGHGPSAGDVKYHMGRKLTRASGVEVELMFNPSHLEAVNPMVLGLARAKGDKLEKDRTKVLPVLLHGDSAVAGQGVVAECNNMSNVKGYYVGGCIHIVLNNQVGFTANPADAFGGKYCTDIFRSLGTPILHVNADDMDACLRVLTFAFEYRQQYGKDVAIDMVGYRRWGHNEGDDPTFTQPVLYAKIKNHPVPAEVYAAKLRDDGVVDDAAYKSILADVTAKLDKAYEEAMTGTVGHSHLEHDNHTAGDGQTAASPAQIAATVEAWKAVPEGFAIHPKIAKVVEERVTMLSGEKPLNWGAAETAAYATLLQDGYGWRLTGQDVKRGTFSHRNAVLTDEKTGERWDVMAPLAKDGAAYCVENSVLSENAVLGFEYGYALNQGTELVQWEAQFGDFANGAQVVIDQFIASAKAKWDQDNAVALLLPHGYEGQGPEHSSARIERFLQLCAEDNLRVCVPTTPAQTFHLLRRQAMNGTKVPLIMMTPKSLLRHPAAVSDVRELTSGQWQPVIADTVEPRDVKKVLLCSGKVYYDLLAQRNDLGDDAGQLAIIRVEELYPWPAKQIAALLDQYKTKNVYWVQEEHRNMGAWSHVNEYWSEVVAEMKEEKYLHYIGRARSASPAAGTMKLHAKELAALMEKVLEGVAGKKRAA